jgi:hemoglobin-like flavoprotein
VYTVNAPRANRAANLSRHFSSDSISRGTAERRIEGGKTILLPDRRPIMDAAAARRIRDNFTSLSGEELATSFYAKLFGDFPHVRAMFPPDMERQQKHLSAALALICRNSDRLALLEEPLMQLGAQHVRYGTRAEHYPIVRDTLIGVLCEASGPNWTPQLEDDWTSALNHIAAVMLKGAAMAPAIAAELKGPCPPAIGGRGLSRFSAGSPLTPAR